MAPSGQAVDAAEIEYDTAEQQYLAAVRRKVSHPELAVMAEEAERRAAQWVDALREHATKMRNQGLPAEETEKEAEIAEAFLRNLWEELAEAHRFTRNDG